MVRKFEAYHAAFGRPAGAPTLTLYFTLTVSNWPPATT